MKNPLIPFAAVLLLVAAPLRAPAQEMVVFADKVFQPALREISPMFTDQTGFKVKFSLAPSEKLAKRIHSGASADLFFPATEESMRQVMEKGLVDVALKRNILALPPGEPTEEGIPPEPQYISAAVLLDATHRLQAMAFLEFLTSEAARGVFARQGFSLP